MKTFAPAISLALLLVACGGADTTTSTRAPQAMRSGDVVPRAAEYTQLTQSLYIGFFGRPADAAGLAFWSKIFSDKALPQTFPEWVAGYGVNPDITNVLDAMVNSVESRELYVSNNASYINAVYSNGFNRYAEAAGREFWAGLIDRGVITRAQGVLRILDGAQNDDTRILAKKIQAATIFTSLLNQEGSASRLLSYATGGYNDGARALLGRITAATDMETFSADIAAFVEELDRIPGDLLVVRRYLGYHYLQDMNGQPLYAAGYTYHLPGYPQILPSAGTLTYGADPQTINWTRSDAAGYAYAAPVSASATVISTNRLPSMTMLCSPVITADGTVIKSTDVLVARNASRLTDATQLANQRFTVYRENCALGGSNLSEFSFDADGNGRFASRNGVLTIDAAGVTQILNGQVQLDLSTGKFQTYAAFAYTRVDGSTGYFIVQHLGNHKSGVTDGVLAVWAQE